MAPWINTETVELRPNATASEEYTEAFGENIVPYIRGYKTEACTSMTQFTHTFQLVRLQAVVLKETSQALH